MAQASSAVEVIRDAGRVRAMLPPLRRRILELLREPDSAVGLSRRLGVPRQKVNYHVRRLEDAGLVELVEERQRRGFTERRLRLTARSFLISPALLAGLSVDPDDVQDRFSSSYLMSAASRIVRDVSVLRERASRARRKLVTMTLEADVALASPADLSGFAQELGDALARLVAKYHKPEAKASRRYRFMLNGHPIITKPEDDTTPGAGSSPANTRKEKP